MSKYEDGSYRSYQCLPGPALIAKVLAGRCKMRYTRAAVGKGTIPEGVSPKSLTEPPDYVMDAQIAAVTNPIDGECQVTVQLNSSNVETGFYAMGIMLYAEDPDLGEVPYTYLKLEEGLEWIRPASSAVGKLATFDLIAAVGDVDAVHANIDPDAIVTYSAVEQLIANAMRFRLFIGDTEPEDNSTFWFNTGAVSKANTVVFLELGGDSDESNVRVEISGTDRPVMNADVDITDPDQVNINIT